MIPVLGALLLAFSVWVLHREFAQIGFPAFVAALHAVPAHTLFAAALLTVLNYMVLTWQDRLAFAYAGVRLRQALIGLASFVGYAVSNNVGFPLVSGTTARYRFYARWGLTSADLSRVVLFYSATFWVGLCLLGGFSLLVAPPANLGAVAPRAVTIAAGVAAILVVVVYAALCVRRTRTIRIAGLTVALPRPTLVAAQIAVSVIDWVLASAVIWVLLPEPRASFLATCGAFVIAQLVGLGSHVPGGLGVFEGVMILMLGRDAPSAALVSALVAFRMIYYVMPLSAALLLLLGDEMLQRREHWGRWSRTCRALATWVAPRIIALFTFASGALLLFSGATPGVPSRLAWLARVVPLPILELSHFAGSLIGLLLLLLAQAVADRVDAAWYLTIAALMSGIAASFLKGADYEEALVLAAVLIAVAAGRHHFTRRARVFQRPLSRSWLAATLVVIAASIWLGLFAYDHVAYTRELWWQFAFEADAPRFLRASVAVSMTALVVALRQLLRPAMPRLPAMASNELADARAVIASQSRATPCLVFLGDKSILWDDTHAAFLMYSVQGRSCVAMGDPVGPPETHLPLIGRFVAMARSFGLIPVFYEVGRHHVSDYADHGLTVVKIGEEARVDLTAFSLVGSRNKSSRTTMNRMTREGYQFRIVTPPNVEPLLPQLADISTDWLTAKKAVEKGFSLGYFDEQYVAHLPIAILERDGRVDAFSNIWQGGRGTEVSPDLMRYRQSAPPGTMDALFAHMMLWAQQEGFKWFNLGMAPLSGLPESTADRAWTRLVRFVYRHGESFYNFQGLRAYKDKFDPVWEPRYLVYAGPMALPRVLADVTALVGGGYTRVFRRSGRRAA